MCAQLYWHYSSDVNQTIQIKMYTYIPQYALAHYASIILSRISQNVLYIYMFTHYSSILLPIIAILFSLEFIIVSDNDACPQYMCIVDNK